MMSKVKGQHQSEVFEIIWGEIVVNNFSVVVRYRGRMAHMIHAVPSHF